MASIKHVPTKRKAEDEGTNTLPPKILPASSSQFWFATPEEIDLAIHNVGFTDAVTKRLQEQVKCPTGKNKVNQALIATRTRLWKKFHSGSRESNILADEEKMLALPMPLAIYYKNQDPHMRRLMELMGAQLEEKQFNEILISCIKNDLKKDNYSAPQGHPKNKIVQENISNPNSKTTTQDSKGSQSDKSHLKPQPAGKNKEESQSDKLENITRYYKFPPVEIPDSSCKICITKYADKFYCVGCYITLETFNAYMQHKKTSKECKKKCRNWEKLRFEPGNEFENELIWGNRTRRPRGQ